MLDDAMGNDAATDPVATEGVDANHSDGGDDDDAVDSDDARKAAYRPHGGRRCRLDWEVTWYPLVREGIELQWWLTNAKRPDVKRIDMLEGGCISISFKASYNEYKDTPDCYMEEYELSISGCGPHPKRTVPRRMVKCRFCDAQMPPVALDAHCFVNHPTVNTVAALRASCPDLPPLDGDTMKHYIDTFELAMSRRLTGYSNLELEGQFVLGLPRSAYIALVTAQQHPGLRYYVDPDANIDRITTICSDPAALAHLFDNRPWFWRQFMDANGFFCRHQFLMGKQVTMVPDVHGELHEELDKNLTLTHTVKNYFTKPAMRRSRTSTPAQ
jgi:hypothetical protein